MNTTGLPRDPNAMPGGGTPGGLDDDRLNDGTVGVDPDLTTNPDMTTGANDADENRDNGRADDEHHSPRPGIETFEDDETDQM
ncbi:MAG: hypothetical protein ACOYBP_08575 [Microbacteriaceae bacterium]